MTRSPHTAATELLAARAADGRRPAVVLQTNVNVFTITLSKPGGRSFRVTVDLPADQLPEPTAVNQNIKPA